jgi:hypothetical protein
MPDVTLDVADAAELAEMLQFLGDWLPRNPGRLAATSFVLALARCGR